MMGRRAGVVVALVASLMSDARTQPAGPPSADARRAAERHRAAGDKHYEANQLAAAIDDYRQAYQLDPRPEFLFSLARLEFDRGDCAAAIGYYRRFLATSPGPKARQRATDAIAECEAQGAPAAPPPRTESADPAKGEGREPHPSPRPGIEPTSPAPTDGVARAGDALARAGDGLASGDLVAARAPGPPEERPWYRDALGASLLGGGTVAGLAAGGLYLLARRDFARADDGGAGGVDLDEYERLTARADSRQWYAAIAGGVGVALVAGGVLRFATRDRGRGGAPEVAISIRHDALAICGRF